LTGIDIIVNSGALVGDRDLWWGTGTYQTSGGGQGLINKVLLKRENKIGAKEK
jgi:hypothetical protein